VVGKQAAKAENDNTRGPQIKVHFSFLKRIQRWLLVPPCSSRIILGAYAAIFGLATAGLEFQIPPQVQRYASFMFSFIGRGVCKCTVDYTFPPLFT
jgi:hypothetical protein